MYTFRISELKAKLLNTKIQLSFWIQNFQQKTLNVYAEEQRQAKENIDYLSSKTLKVTKHSKNLNKQKR